MGKVRGPQCCAFECSKRKKVGPKLSKSIRSDSEGSSDEENFPGHFISKQFIFTSILFYRLKLDLHYMINILYRFPKGNVPAS